MSLDCESRRAWHLRAGLLAGGGSEFAGHGSSSSVYVRKATLQRHTCLTRVLPPLPAFCSPAENSSTDQRQACKKHELYVSFRDLGWQVRGGPGSPIVFLFCIN